MTPDFLKELQQLDCLLKETDAAYHEAAVKLGLPDSSMSILYTLCNAGGSCPLREICLNSGISKQTINSALRRLEADDILYLKTAGGKNKTVHLTGKGHRLARETAGKIIAIENDIFSSWTRADVEKYLELAERYLQDFKKRSDKLTKNEDKTNP